MSLRRSLPAAVALAALALAACGESSTSTGPTTGPLAGAEVSGASPAPSLTQAPTVKLDKTPVVAGKVESQVVTKGTGPEVETGQIVKLKALIIDGADGKVATSTFNVEPISFVLAEGQTFPALVSTLPGAPVGSRVLVSSPPAEAFGAEGRPDIGIDGKDSVLFLVDILGATTPLTEAKGKAVKPQEGLPTVSVKAGEQAKITTLEGVKAPTKLVVQPLIEGTGPVVKSGQTVRVAYTGAIWGTDKVFDSSAKTPEKFFETPIGVGRVVPGWDKGIVDRTVGSRLLLSIPPADGYGAQGQGDIKGTDTMVFVVDILAAY